MILKIAFLHVFSYSVFGFYIAHLVYSYIAVWFTYIPLYINYCSFVIIPLAGKALYLWIHYIDVFTTRNVELRNLCVACTRDVILNISDSRTQKNRKSFCTVYMPLSACKVYFSADKENKQIMKILVMYFHHYSK